MVKADGFGEQRMRANHNLHITSGDVLADVSRLASRCHPRQHTYFYRKTGKSLDENLAMLACQQGCRGHHRHLIPGHRRDKGRTQCHFGFAKANIATNQPVTGLARCQIIDHVGDCIELVICFAKGKSSTKFSKTAIFSQ